jgi:FtsH-binding integral membrane protein
MRGLAIFALTLGLILLGIVLAFPHQVRLMSENDIARLVWLLAAALFVGGGAFAYPGRRGGPLTLGRGALYPAIWAGLIVAMVALYQLAQSIAAGGRVAA